MVMKRPKKYSDLSEADKKNMKLVFKRDPSTYVKCTVEQAYNLNEYYKAWQEEFYRECDASKQLGLDEGIPKKDKYKDYSNESLTDSEYEALQGITKG
jgi:hypothetical protein